MLPFRNVGDEALLQGGKLGSICFQRCPGGRDSEDLRLCPAGTRIGSCRLVTFGFLAVVRSRDALVSARVQLINAVRGLVKSMADGCLSTFTRQYHPDFRIQYIVEG